MAWWRRNQAGANSVGMPSDEETADIMRRIADEFVRDSGASDLLDYTVESVANLEVLIDEMVAAAPAAAVDERLGLSMGAYVGEVVVRHSSSAFWAYDRERRTAVVQSAEFDAFPAYKVSKRITIGPEHSLLQFVRAAIEDALPPEARVLS